MRINNVLYLLKEGVKSIFVHGFMSFAAVCVTVACLLIVGMFAGVMHNVNIMVADLNQTNEVLVYIDETLPESEARSVGTEINMVSNVLRAEFVTREQALEEFIQKHDGDAAFNGLNAQTLRHRYVIVLEDNGLMRETVETLRQISGVAEVVAYYEVAEGFAMIQDVLSVAFVVVLAVLLVVSLLIISNTVKIAMYGRKEEIAIMRMVGATNSFIRLPFVVQGFLLGMIGAGIAFAVEWWTYDAMVAWLHSKDTLQILSFVAFQELLPAMVATFAAAGLFVGIVGSWTSIQKFMKV